MKNNQYLAYSPDYDVEIVLTVPDNIIDFDLVFHMAAEAIEKQIENSVNYTLDSMRVKITNAIGNVYKANMLKIWDIEYYY